MRKSFAVVEFGGRTDDVVSFTQNGATIKLAPLAIYATLKEVQEIRRFQFITHSNSYVELRIEPSEGFTIQAAFAKAKISLESFFAIHKLTNIDIRLSDDKPKQDAGSGKFKHIVRAK